MTGPTKGKWHPKSEDLLLAIEREIDGLEVTADKQYVIGRGVISSKLNELALMAANSILMDKARDVMMDIAANEYAWQAMTQEQRVGMREVFQHDT
tara:strand:- start:242 stop:529 length:288 start_codon:yes stop_codon:yes gene_type:complete